MDPATGVANPPGPSAPSSSLLTLPPELLLSIVENLADDKATLCSLAQVCRRFQPLSEEHIYNKIEIEITDDLRAILDAFNARPVRVDVVKTLKIVYKHHESLSTTLEDRVAFNGFVGKMKLLQNWHIESPYDNFMWESGGHEWVLHDMEQFRQSLEGASLQLSQKLQENVGLSKLEKLVIHSHGAHADYWELKGFHCLFRHPSLRTLHISCVTLPSDLPELADYVAKTPLTTLIFDECELIPQSLGRILATPKSLKHLTLGENVCNNRERSVNPRLSKAPDAAIKALSHVSHSLETLVHLDPHFATLPDPQHPPELRLRGSGMRDFHRLAFLECDRCSFLHQGIISNRELAPPNLATIRLHQSGRLASTSFWDSLPDHTPYANLSSLKLVEFTAPSTLRTSAYHASEYVGRPDRLRDRHAWAFKLWNHGIGVKMYAEVHDSYSLIPPYLHGELKPELVLLYDSIDVGFKRRLPFPEDMEENMELTEEEEMEAQKNLTVTDKLGMMDVLTITNNAYRALRRHKVNIDRQSAPGSRNHLTFTELMLELMPEFDSENGMDVAMDEEAEDFIGEVEDDGDEAWEDEDSDESTFDHHDLQAYLDDIEDEFVDTSDYDSDDGMDIDWDNF